MQVGFENEGKGLIFVAEGVLSGEQLIRQTEKTYQATECEQLCYQIIDLRQVERMDITAEQIKQVAQLDCQAAENGRLTRIALVADHDLTIGLSRIYSAYAQSACLQTRVFRSEEEARAWLAADERLPLEPKN